MKSEAYPIVETPDANRSLRSFYRYCWNKLSSRRFNFEATQRGSKRVATTSPLCALVVQVRRANLCESIIWLTVAASAVVALALSLSLET
jgi:hypothetical protein